MKNKNFDKLVQLVKYNPVSHIYSHPSRSPRVQAGLLYSSVLNAASWGERIVKNFTALDGLHTLAYWFEVETEDYSEEEILDEIWRVLYLSESQLKAFRAYKEEELKKELESYKNESLEETFKRYDAQRKEAEEERQAYRKALEEEYWETGKLGGPESRA